MTEKTAAKRQVSTTERGREYEKRASRYLAQEGLKVIGRNVRTAGGELDIIAWDGDVLCFVEVRARARGGELGAIASVTPAKQQRVARAAAAFLQENPKVGMPPCRFDVVSFHGDQLDHLCNAFTADASATGYES